MHVNTNNRLSSQRPFYVDPTVNKTILILDDFPLSSFIEENKLALLFGSITGGGVDDTGNSKKEAETRRALHDSKHLLV
jgi:hypothetical protein